MLSAANLNRLFTGGAIDEEDFTLDWNELIQKVQERILKRFHRKRRPQGSVIIFVNVMILRHQPLIFL